MRNYKVILGVFLVSLAALPFAYVLKPELVKAAFQKELFSLPMLLTMLVCILCIIYGCLRHFGWFAPRGQSQNLDAVESE